MIRIVLVGYLFMLTTPLLALVPVEGILLGESVIEYQQDPLHHIFKDIYDKSEEGENRKIKLYQNTIESGIYLQESCRLYDAPRFGTTWMDKQAKRSVASTLQYLGLDLSIKAIGAYARKLQVHDDGFKQLTKNLVKNYCSKNLTVFSVKRIEQSLDHYYNNPVSEIIPSVESSPFSTEHYKKISESELQRSREFDQAINNFRAFCSWGGDVTDYRMLVPYLRNGFIMNFVIGNLMGVQDKYDQKSNKVEKVRSENTVQVECEDLICRKVPLKKFESSYPRSIGSTGLYTDLVKLYCHHFKFQDYSSATAIPQVKEWIKKQELEDPIFETSFFISLLTGVPDPVFGVENYRDLPLVAKSSIDERWTKWSNDVLSIFSKDLLYEESLNIKALPLRDRVKLRTEGFNLEFNVTLGEMDRVVDETDKLTTGFTLKLSKNFLRHIKVKWTLLNNNLEEEEKKNFREELSRYIDLQLKEKEKLFRQKMWNEDFSRLIVQELIGQLTTYKGPLFDSYEEQIIEVPIRFNYGIFALSYLRYRSEVKEGRVRLNL